MSTPGDATRSRTRLRGAILYALYLVAFVVGVAWLGNLRYVRSIRPETFADNVVIPGIDPALSSQLGAIPPPTERASAFGNVPREKPAGRVRIGCFGDSFTWGSEVANGNDYPAILQRLVADEGRSEVEVLNFGSPAFGLHQSVLLWEKVGRDYGLDHVVVLGWGRTWMSRDSTFHYWTAPAKKLGFHARYVLDGDGLALAEILGVTEEERFDAYMRFPTPLRYLRWDRRPPPFLEAWLPASRTLQNPFYYRDDVDAEIKETYRRLLARVGRQAPGALLVDIDGLLAALAGECSPPCLPFVRLPLQLGFPYRMLNEHFSPLGNRLAATTVLRGLYPKPERPSGVIRVGPEPVPGDPTGPPIALRDAARIDIALDDRVVGGFYTRPRYAMLDRPARLDHLPPGVQRLMAVVGSGQTLLDAAFLPLPSAEGVPVVALETNGSALPLAIAPSPVGSPELGILRLDLCDAAAFRRALDVAPSGACRVVRMRDLPAGRRAQVLVDGAPAIAVSVNANDGVSLAVLADPDYVVLPDGDGPADDPGSGGFVDVRLADAAGGRRQVHLAAWTLVPFSLR